MQLRWIVVVVGLVLLAGACSGGEDDGHDGAQSSPEAVVAAYYEALSSGDLDEGFALLSPERREGLTESEWSACMVDRLETDPPGSVYRYEHGSTWTEQGYTFAEGRVAAEADGTLWAERYVRWAVTDIGGEWYAVAMILEPEPDCLGTPFRAS